MPEFFMEARGPRDQGTDALGQRLTSYAHIEGSYSPEVGAYVMIADESASLSDEELDELIAHLQQLRGRPMPIDPLVSMARFLVTLWGSSIAEAKLNTTMPSPPAYTGPPIVTAYCYQRQYARWPHDGRSDEMSWTRSFDIVASD